MRYVSFTSNVNADAAGNPALEDMHLRQQNTCCTMWEECPSVKRCRQEAGGASLECARQSKLRSHWLRPHKRRAALDRKRMSSMITSPTGAGARPGSRTSAGACSAAGSRHRTRARPAVATDAPSLRRAAGWQRSSDGGAASCRGPAPAAASSSSSSLSGSDKGDYAALQGKKVYSAATGAEVELAALWRAQPGTRCVVVFLTHFADLSSTELAQKLLPVLPEVGPCPFLLQDSVAEAVLSPAGQHCDRAQQPS